MEEAIFVPLSQEIHKRKAIFNIQLGFSRLWNLMPSLQALSLTKQSNNFPTPSFPTMLLDFLAKLHAAFLSMAGSLNDSVLRFLRQHFRPATCKFNFTVVQALVPITLDKVLPSCRATQDQEINEAAASRPSRNVTAQMWSQIFSFHCRLKQQHTC